ncbi:MAG TPA: glycosyltransferase family 25 protein [Pseudaminobacter sp.]|nr:glycosyltransferase family 25 protein [Pseudaminobacter sp.]
MVPEILVINLDRSPDRLAFIASQMQRLGLEFTRLKATDATMIGDDEFKRLGGTYMRPLSRTELACLHSHSRAWRHCVDSNRPVLVLEDDVVLSEKLPSWLAELDDIDMLDILNLETRGAEKWVSRRPYSSAPKSGIRHYRLFVDRGGSGGYLVRPAAARRLLQRAKHYAAPSDAFLNLAGIPRLRPSQGWRRRFMPRQARRTDFAALSRRRYPSRASSRGSVHLCGGRNSSCGGLRAISP